MGNVESWPIVGKIGNAGPIEVSCGINIVVGAT
jgi:hypothetical protein